ncbi:MAG TPA: cupin domain-containing protein [Acidimicrobiia bacterium]|nr:cupin domain-containing protein [Acidimicrobiia bacterium]
MSQDRPIVDPTTLTLQLTALVPEAGNHVRQTLFDEIEARLPRDPEARVNIQLSELNPGRTASWHVHNGVVYFVLLRGLVSLQYEGRTEHYSAGEVYTEPIGVTHRAFNPHPEIPASLIGFWVTAADRPHITETGAPVWAPETDPHPSLH